MYSMWDAPSDRDYRGSDSELPEDEERCRSCGAGADEACEESCASRAPVEVEDDCTKAI